MQRFYQTEWFNISLASFGSLDYFKLASADFYNAFYAAFFEKYESYEKLPQKWREQKYAWAEAIHENIKTINAPQVLSVGAGLGYVESVLMDLCPGIKMHCTEVAETSLRWLIPHVPKERIYIGFVPQCLPSSVAFDCIFCGTIDYAMPNKVWVSVLKSLRGWLKPGGALCVLTASLEIPVEGAAWSKIKYYKNQFKGALRHLLGVEHQQFWGYSRTKEENIALLHKAGYSTVSAGPLGDEHSCMFFKAQI